MASESVYSLTLSAGGRLRPQERAGRGEVTVPRAAADTVPGRCGGLRGDACRPRLDGLLSALPVRACEPTAASSLGLDLPGSAHTLCPARPRPWLAPSPFSAVPISGLCLPKTVPPACTGACSPAVLWPPPPTRDALHPSGPRLCARAVPTPRCGQRATSPTCSPSRTAPRSASAVDSEPQRTHGRPLPCACGGALALSGAAWGGGRGRRACIPDGAQLSPESRPAAGGGSPAAALPTKASGTAGAGHAAAVPQRPLTLGEQKQKPEQVKHRTVLGHRLRSLTLTALQASPVRDGGGRRQAERRNTPRASVRPGSTAGQPVAPGVTSCPPYPHRARPPQGPGQQPDSW